MRSLLGRGVTPPRYRFHYASLHVQVRLRNELSRIFARRLEAIYASDPPAPGDPAQSPPHVMPPPMAPLPPLATGPEDGARGLEGVQLVTDALERIERAAAATSVPVDVDRESEKVAGGSAEEVAVREAEAAAVEAKLSEPDPVVAVVRHEVANTVAALAAREAELVQTAQRYERLGCVASASAWTRRVRAIGAAGVTRRRH